MALTGSTPEVRQSLDVLVVRYASRCLSKPRAAGAFAMDQLNNRCRASPFATIHALNGGKAKRTKRSFHCFLHIGGNSWPVSVTGFL
jgi:hypothetical protein